MAGIDINGKEISKAIRKDLKSKIKKLKEEGIQPGLAAVLVGDDPASATYVRSKERACEKLGIYSEIIRKDDSMKQDELIDLIKSLNENPKIHGILVQSPLPSHMDELTVTLTIDPRKDVDGFHPYNVGMMLLGRATLLPCTPYGIIKMLEYSDIDPTGKEVVVVGRSNIVGKPIAAMLMQKWKVGNATVTVAHSRSKNLAEIIKRADIVIAAIGKAHAITAYMVKDGVVVIDVGINRIDDPGSEKGYKIVGDVDYDAVREKASYITPVPGGVGLMTIAMLMTNTVTAAEMIEKFK